MNKNGLDEMQLQRKNKIGNQSFLLLVYLLLIDAGLYGYGFRWLRYPVNVMVILMVCSTYYLIRVIFSNAYVGPGKAGDKPVRKTILIVIAASSFGMILSFILKNTVFTQKIEGANDSGGLILFIISAVALIIVSIVAIISKRQNKEDEKF